MSSTPSIATLHGARRFPFRALAALAGRQPIGGDREVALACLMTARLASGVLDPDALPPAVRAERAAAARAWLASLTIPASLRPALVRAIDASGRDRPRELADALRVLTAAATAQLDAPSRADLERLAARLADEG